MLVSFLTVALLLDPTPRAPSPKPAPQAALHRIQDHPAQPDLSSVAVTLECTARASGRVENCQVLGETHPGLGFGDAAVALMRDATVPAGPADVQFARTIQFMP